MSQDLSSFYLRQTFIGIGMGEPTAAVNLLNLQYSRGFALVALARRFIDTNDDAMSDSG